MRAGAGARLSARSLGMLLLELLGLLLGVCG